MTVPSLALWIKEQAGNNFPLCERKGGWGLGTPRPRRRASDRGLGVPRPQPPRIESPSESGKSFPACS